MESRIWSRRIEHRDRFRDILVLLLFPIGIISISIFIGLALVKFGPLAWAIIIGILVMAIVIFLRYFELAITFIIAIHIYVDYYLGTYLLGGLLAIILLAILLGSRSFKYPWVKPNALWLWFLFLLIALLPAFRGINLADGLNYYFNVFCCPLIFLLLGTVIGHNVINLRRLLTLLSCLGTFVAFVSVIQYFTSNLIFNSSRYDASLLISNDFELFLGDNIHRVGAYFVHPNSNGSFISMMICITIGLIINSPSIKEKIFYVAEISIMLPSLLFTYSTESWIAVSVGIFVFFVLVGRNDYRILILTLILASVVCMITLFPLQLALLQQHATTPIEVQMRQAAWQTGLAVIRANPLTGLGLGRHVYLLLADPYRVPTQTQPLDHPHNSFLELSALGGLPIAIMFVILLLFAFWKAFRNWTFADMHTRPLIGAGIAAAAALTSYSMSDAGWTLPPLLAIGWLVLGSTSSPHLRKVLSGDTYEENLS
jgi:O-antigen ligase